MLLLLVGEAVGQAASPPVSSPYFLQYALPIVWERFTQIVTAPFQNPEMLWITLPLLVALLMMELYFGRYRKEQLGWSSAVGNSLVLVFVSLDLLRQVYSATTPYTVQETFLLNTWETIIAIAVGFSGLLILYYDFFHLLPKRFAFTISSSLAVNITAYLAIVVIYTNLKVDWYTFFAAVMLFLVAAIFFAIMRRVEPKPKERYYVNRAERLIAQLFRPAAEAGASMKRKRKKNKHLKPES